MKHSTSQSLQKVRVRNAELYRKANPPKPLDTGDHPATGLETNMNTKQEATANKLQFIDVITPSGHQCGFNYGGNVPAGSLEVRGGLSHNLQFKALTRKDAADLANQITSGEWEALNQVAEIAKLVSNDWDDNYDKLQACLAALTNLRKQ